MEIGKASVDPPEELLLDRGDHIDRHVLGFGLETLQGPGDLGGRTEAIDLLENVEEIARSGVEDVIQDGADGFLIRVLGKGSVAAPIGGNQYRIVHWVGNSQGEDGTGPNDGAESTGQIARAKDREGIAGFDDP